MKYGLVLEGGAMRGIFSAGVMDILMENNIIFDGAVAVSYKQLTQPTICSV